MKISSAGGRFTHETRKKVLAAQRKEITEHLVYRALARRTKDRHNREILERMASDELEDYNLWKSYTKQDVKPQRLEIFQHVLISRLFGVTFAIKLLERDNQPILAAYELLSASLPDGKNFIKSRLAQEREFVQLIDEQWLRYIGSIVLGLNDALVELTGVLAGFTFALQNTLVIAVAGLITGIAASLSMAASVYLSTESGKSPLSPARSASYTGLAYLATVLFLVYPYLVFGNPFVSLALTVIDAVLVITLFSYHSSVTQGTSFAGKFRKMALVSLGVAAITFGIGFAVRKLFNITI